ncbi:hypothetical protein N8497_00070 [bacterium]|nr:hypothetical protein [bacterium]
MNPFKPLNRGLLIAGLGISLAGFGGEQPAEASIRNRVRGTVSVMGKPVADASVTLWTTRGGQEPEQVKVVRSKKDGSFAVSVKPKDGTVHYLVASGGTVNKSNVDRLTMLTVLDETVNGTVMINERTTVGSVWPNAQQLKGNQLFGSKNALAVGSGHVRHLVNQSTGQFGTTLLNGFNLLSSETAARINVLSDLLALCGDPTKEQGCTKLFQLTEATNSLDAMTNIAKLPWKNTGKLYKLFDKNYPLNNNKERRTTASLPYLLFQPESFSLSIRFQGGGALALGKLGFDQKGHLWSGANWMPGSQSGVVNSIGGGMTHFDQTATAQSPPITGYNGQGLDGVGWGTGISENYAWVSTFNNKVGVFDLKDGTALGPATIDKEVGQLQGIGTSKNGDVWIADNTRNYMIRFPGGDFTKGKRLSFEGLQAPFGVAVDDQNRIWVSSSFNNKLTVIEGDSPDQFKTVTVALGARGLAIDSKGNAWLSQQSNSPTGALPAGAVMPPGTPNPPQQPKTIMEEFEAGAAFAAVNPNLKTLGNLALISPDLDIIQNGIAGEVAFVPWGVTIDGNDNVWVGNLYGQSLIHICGTDPSTCPEGKTTGDVIHNYQSGVIQVTTDVVVDDAGNIWSANNWFDADVVINKSYNARTSTFPGGQGLVVTYGVAAPVQNPLMGAVRKPN